MSKLDVSFTGDEKRAMQIELDKKTRPAKRGLLSDFGFDDSEIDAMVPVIECMAAIEPGCSEKIYDFIQEKLIEKEVKE